MNKVILRIDKDKHVYIPGHKKFVQLFKQLPYTLEEDEEGEVIPKKEWEYDGKEIGYNKEWEMEIGIDEDGEEYFLTAEQYLYKHFNEVWDNN